MERMLYAFFKVPLTGSRLMACIFLSTVQTGYSFLGINIQVGPTRKRRVGARERLPLHVLTHRYICSARCWMQEPNKILYPKPCTKPWVPYYLCSVSRHIITI
ncbi:hypothetical protein V8C42DRAFT_310966, partial [Trichoderma barbatum]